MSEGSSLNRWIRRVTRTLAILFFIGLGGVLFNLDRLGDAELQLLRYKRLLPAPVRMLLPGEGAPSGIPAPLDEYTGRIIEVHDGDTATLLSGDRKYRIRFYGIDAPELSQRGGAESHDALSSKILGADVVVCVTSVDHYGRAVGRVKLGERDINLEMVREGQAWYYSNYAKGDTALAAADEYARSRKTGLWRDPAPQPPWEYRRAQRAR